jgi:hypothetical protein
MINASAKVQTDRLAAERRIAALEAKRAKQLVAAVDIAAIDQTDAAIAAEKRAIVILDQRLAALARADRKLARKNREADRTAALAVIGPLLDQRTALATELEAALKRVVVLHDQIMDDKPLVGAWPFNLTDQHQFMFRFRDLGIEILRTLRDQPGGYAMLPGKVRAQLSTGGGGVTQVFVKSTVPDDLPGKVAHDGAHILSVLGTVNIHGAEPADDDDKVKLEAAE